MGNSWYAWWTQGTGARFTIDMKAKGRGIAPGLLSCKSLPAAFAHFRGKDTPTPENPVERPQEGK